ncbi:DUF262 domain-containing protein [Fusobacterium varium]|uniref:DUF262 domain-containing protein n=1 Tax=Fusobacterium varium TaxID=856 RepID=UPI0032C0BC5B
MNDYIELKAIKDIKDCEFYIPSYQRGYRWTKQQVIDLLEDIFEFSQQEPKKEEFYCLQPLIVKNILINNEKKWEVIDGQQRLTTIYLIMLYIKKNIFLKQEKSFSIEYETRVTSKEFLENIDENKKDENVDFYHIYSAYFFIKNWFKEKEDETSLAIDIYKKIFEQTKFIWYQVSENIDSINIFTRINLGKIPLTNSELIKALFLKKNNFRIEEEIYMKQLEIAKEWDRIEYTLQNDEFWYFISNGIEEYNPRIEFIFSMMAKEMNKKYQLDIDERKSDYFDFIVFNTLFEKKKGHGINELWLEIKKYFMKFEEWFEEKETYHLIGYLVTTDLGIDTIKKETESLKKNELREYLDKKIIKTISNNKIIEEWEYVKDKKKIKNLLLLFNIITLLLSKESNIRFSFNKYKIDKWDIEHIHTVNSDIPNDYNQRKEWLEVILNEIEDNKKDESLSILAKKIKEAINTKIFMEDEKFKKICEEIALELGENLEIDDISNFALLDARTNRSYKNAIFPIKRKIILKNDMAGNFIPLCTKNVFLKYYSDNVKQMVVWGEYDRKKYLEAIKETLRKYLLKSGGMNNE